MIREGWEGLVRGNSSSSRTVPSTPVAATPPAVPSTTANDPLAHAHPNVLNSQPLSFGSGELFKYQVYDSLEDDDQATELDPNEVDHHGGKYIIRVGWDDVRGWLGEVRLRRTTLLPSVYLHRILILPFCFYPGRNAHWNSSICCLYVFRLLRAAREISRTDLAVYRPATPYQSERPKGDSSPLCILSSRVSTAWSFVEETEV